MSTVLRFAALLVTSAAVIAAGTTLAATRRVTVALPVLLDLLLAAGLLRLALHPGPAQLLGTALLVVVKRLASAGIASARTARARAT